MVLCFGSSKTKKILSVNKIRAQFWILDGFVHLLRVNLENETLRVEPTEDREISVRAVIGSNDTSLFQQPLQITHIVRVRSVGDFARRGVVPYEQHPLDHVPVSVGGGFPDDIMGLGHFVDARNVFGVQPLQDFEMAAPFCGLDQVVADIRFPPATDHSFRRHIERVKVIVLQSKIGRPMIDDPVRAILLHQRERA